MNDRINKAYFLIPLLYVVAIILLLFLQFSGSGRFSAEVAGISIEGQTRAGAPGKQNSISELSIAYKGVVFSFNHDNPFLIYSQDGLVHKTRPINYRVTALGVDVYLSKGVTCSFYKSTEADDKMNITVKVEDPASIKKLKLPISKYNVTLKEDLTVSAVSITTESNGIYCLTIPEGGAFDNESSAVVIVPEEQKALELSFEQSSGYGIDAFSFWKNKVRGVISDSSLKREIDIYIEKSKDALLNERIDSSNGTWAAGEKQFLFYEDALVMATSETIGTNLYRSAKKVLDRSATMHSNDLSIESSCLYGNIVNEVWAFNENIKDEISIFTKRAETADYSIFSEKDIIPVLLTEKSKLLQRELLSMAENLSEVKDYNTAINMLYFYSELYEKDSAMGKKYSNITNLIDSVILPSLTIIENRPYIVGANRCGDIKKTLETGVYLFKNNPIISEETHNFIGRELINSVLLLADQSGFLPKEISLSKEEKIQKTGLIRPESVYPLLSDNTFYPDMDYFFLDSGETISVFNQADDFNIETTDYGYRLTFKFPRTETHRFAIRNIEPFYMLYLFGGRWSSDHRFQSFSSGWWYDRQHSTLFVKINHKSETEEIRIYKDAP